MRLVLRDELFPCFLCQVLEVSLVAGVHQPPKHQHFLLVPQLFSKIVENVISVMQMAPMKLSLLLELSNCCLNGSLLIGDEDRWLSFHSTEESTEDACINLLSFVQCDDEGQRHHPFCGTAGQKAAKLPSTSLQNLFDHREG